MAIDSSVTVEVLSHLARQLRGDGRDGKLVWREPLTRDLTLGELLGRLAEQRPSFRALYDPADRRVAEHIEVVLNGRLYELAGGLDARLQPGDIVTIFPGYAGG